LGASDHGWNMDPAASLALAPGSYSGMGGPASSATAPLSYTTANDASLADNRMHAISLKPDTSGFMVIIIRLVEYAVSFNVIYSCC